MPWQMFKINDSAEDLMNKKEKRANNTAVKYQPRKRPVSEKPRKLSRRARIIILISAILVAAIIAGIVAGVIYYRNKRNEPFDYLNEDLGKYIYISPENRTGYKGYEVTIAIDEITDDSVRTAIMQILTGERGDHSATGGGETNATVEVGDDILLYFQAYAVNEDGSRGDAIDGLGNFTVSSDEKRTYAIGGGALDKLGLNLELKLVGTDLSKYTACRIASDGEVSEGDIVFITYDAYAMTSGGRWEKKSGSSVRLNLDGDVDAAWGEGFLDSIVGMQIGKTVDMTGKTDFKTEEYSQIVYNNVKIEYVMRRMDADQEPVCIKTTVPCTYSTVALQGTPVIFELYIDYAVKYNVPELNENFIKETLKVTDEVLAEYQGEDTVEKFYSYMRDLLEKQNQAEIDEILIEAMWSHYYSIAQFKELPQAEVNRLVRQQRNSIETAYKSNNGGYSSLDEYANAYVAYFGYELVWTDYIKLVAESQIKEKLIFYYVARAENLLPTDEEYRTLAAKIIEEDIAYYLLANGIKRENYESDEAYNEAAQPYRDKVNEAYSDESDLRYTVDLEYAEGRMSKMAIVKYKDLTGGTSESER